MKNFSDCVKHKLKYYVYALVDPRNDQVFYIGKGINDRVFQHETEQSENNIGNKLNRIKDIIASGNEVKKLIVLYGLTEEAAFAAEAALINIAEFLGIGRLTNVVSGHHADAVMTVDQIEQIYGAAKLHLKEIKHNLLVIKVNSLYSYGMCDEQIMDCARGHWVINTENAKNVDYLIATYHGLVVGIYENMTWYPSGMATDYYPRLCEENLALTNRKYCTCSSVKKENEVYQKYMGKNLGDLIKNIQNPISYIWGRAKTDTSF